MQKTVFGLDRVASGELDAKKWGNVGVVANQASRDLQFKNSIEVLKAQIGSNLRCIFGPQHGFISTVQDNMIETPHAIHELFNIPIYSLYSETREPTEEMFSDIDTVVFDLQISGCRIYTYKATLYYAMQACKKFSKKMVVLDRPNPLGGEVVEGSVLEETAKSFVGPKPIPMRHAMTPGEIAKFFNSEFEVDLEVIEMFGWNPLRDFSDTGRNWILTSPNMPTLESALVFPGMVLFEGTNLSEGRGTCLPFQLIGAPYIPSSEAFLEKILSYGPNLKGITLIPTQFEPTSQKWAGRTCNGVQILVDRNGPIPETIGLGLSMIRAAYDLNGGDFEWKTDPYEYDFNTLPIKLIYGQLDFDQKMLADDFNLGDRYFVKGIKDYCELMQQFMIYDRKLKPGSMHS